jgi:hypothetical protein
MEGERQNPVASRLLQIRMTRVLTGKRGARAPTGSARALSQSPPSQAEGEEGGDAASIAVVALLVLSSSPPLPVARRGEAKEPQDGRASPSRGRRMPPSQFERGRRAGGRR